jgi:hypothetical protein
MLNIRGGLVTKNYYRRGGVVSRNRYRKNISRLGFAPGGLATTDYGIGFYDEEPPQLSGETIIPELRIGLKNLIDTVQNDDNYNILSKPLIQKDLTDATKQTASFILENPAREVVIDTVKGFVEDKRFNAVMGKLRKEIFKDIGNLLIKTYPNDKTPQFIIDEVEKTNKGWGVKETKTPSGEPLTEVLTAKGLVSAEDIIEQDQQYPWGSETPAQALTSLLVGDAQAGEAYEPDVGKAYEPDDVDMEQFRIDYEEEIKKAIKHADLDEGIDAQALTSLLAGDGAHAGEVYEPATTAGSGILSGKQLTDWFNKGKNIRVPGEDTAKWKTLLADSKNQLTRTDEAFKAGEKGVKGWRPLNAFTKKMLATGPDAATRQLLLRAPSLLSKVSPWIQGLMPGKLHAGELPEYGTPEYYEVMKQADERWKNYNNNNNTLLNRNSIAEGSAVNKKERRTKRIATAEKERREIEKYEAAQAAIAAKKAAETQRKAAAEAARKAAEEAARKAAERPKNNWRNGVQTKESIDRGNRAVEQAGGSMDDFSDIPAPTPSRPTPSTSSRGPAGGPPPSSSRSSSRGGGNRWGPSSHMI